MLDSFVWAIVSRFILIVVVLQIITVAIITVSYKLRRRDMPQTGYDTVDLERFQIGEIDVQLYMEGVSLFADMEAAIDSAENTILFETFIWKNDVLGQKLRDLFIKKAQEGVHVYLVYDWLGNGFLGGSSIKFPVDIPTLHVCRYFAFRRWFHWLMPSYYNVTHRKLLAVDSKVGFVGGYNLGEEYRTEWRDTHMRIEGPAVHRLAHAFVDFWNHYSDPQDDLPYPHLHWSNVLDVYRNDPIRRNYPIRSVYLQAIERAQDHIFITNAYFVPDPAFRQALLDAAKRGVDVQVILPWESNHLAVDWVARHFFSDYLAAGVKLFGYEAAMIHAKTVTIDGEWSTVGTANLDRLSLWFNHEVNIEVYDQMFASQMEAMFACDKEHTRPILRDEWETRPIQARWGERILSPLWPFV